MTSLGRFLSVSNTSLCHPENVIETSERRVYYVPKTFSRLLSKVQCGMPTKISLEFLPHTVITLSPLGSKVFGGKEANRGELGFMTSLRINKTHFCGGSLISEYHILTAARCTCRINRDGGPHLRYVTALIGANNLPGGGFDYAIKRTEAFEKYNPHDPSQKNDYEIGVILVGIN